MAGIQKAIRDLPLIKVSCGETLLKEGETHSKLYFLINGSVEIIKDGIQIARVSDPEAVFGEMSILLKQPHSATVRALEDSTFRVADHPLEILQFSPGLALYVAEILARRLDALNRYLVDVKSQFKDRSDHLGMVDEVLDTLMNKHPRKLERRESPEP